MLPPPPRPPPRDACVLPTSKVNGGIIVVLFKYVRPSGLVYGAHTCEDCHSIYSISLTGNIHIAVQTNIKDRSFTRRLLGSYNLQATLYLCLTFHQPPQVKQPSWFANVALFPDSDMSNTYFGKKNVESEMVTLYTTHKGKYNTNKLVEIRQSCTQGSNMSAMRGLWSLG